MTEENTEMATIDETPKPEEPPETVEEMKPETTEDHKNEIPKPSRVKIREVAKQKTECQDCHKTITMKTARYTHKDKCEGKPSNIIEKPVRKNNVKPKVQVKPVSVESHEEPIIHKAPPPVSKAMPPPPASKHATLRQFDTGSTISATYENHEPRNYEKKTGESE